MKHDTYELTARREAFNPDLEEVLTDVRQQSDLAEVARKHGLKAKFSSDGDSIDYTVRGKREKIALIVAALEERGWALESFETAIEYADGDYEGHFGADALVTQTAPAA